MFRPGSAIPYDCSINTCPRPPGPWGTSALLGDLWSPGRRIFGGTRRTRMPVRKRVPRRNLKGAVRVGHRPPGSNFSGTSARSVLAAPNGLQTADWGCDFYGRHRGRRDYNRARFGDPWVTPSQLAPASLMRFRTLHLGSACSRGSCVLAQLQVSQRGRAFPRFSGCIHAYFMN
jgi:hypothetical protein